MRSTPFVALSLAGFWITASEFIRNELLFRHFWVDHYADLGLSFETLPLNGLLWMVWSFLLASVLYVMLQRFAMREAIGLVWVLAFLMMWITLFNLQVLPLGLLLVAVPLSLLEVSLAAWILRKYRTFTNSTT